MKPKYGPQDKPYAEDINDMVESTLSKGGKGSGIRGHKTFREHKIAERHRDAVATGKLDKLRGLNSIHSQNYESAKRAGNKEDMEYHKKYRDEASHALMGRLKGQVAVDSARHANKMRDKKADSDKREQREKQERMSEIIRRPYGDKK